MWNLDDEAKYVKLHSFVLSEAFTYADTRKGQTDRDKRDRIRTQAAKGFPQKIPPNINCWAFRIFVKKSGKRSFDIENVPKLIVDAFCKKQIKDDGSQYTKLGLFDDDTIDYVGVIEVGGLRSKDENTTKVEIFGRKNEEKG